MAERNVAYPTGSVSPLDREAALLGVAIRVLRPGEQQRVRRAFSAVVAMTTEMQPGSVDHTPSVYPGNDNGEYGGHGNWLPPDRILGVWEELGVLNRHEELRRQ